MPPRARPFPRFIADSAQDARPYGEWETRLREAFALECGGLASEAGAEVHPESLRFFPERTWGERTFIPVTGRASGDAVVEYFGHVSFTRAPEGEVGELTATADFTDVIADENPDWEVDLNDDVVGEWRADGGRGGEVTLIWGTPLVRGAVAATAELEDEVLDQSAVNDGRFSLMAVDAVSGFGDDDLYLEIKLWDRKLRPLASESLYEADDEGESANATGEADAETPGAGGSSAADRN